MQNTDNFNAEIGKILQRFSPSQQAEIKEMLKQNSQHNFIIIRSVIRERIDLEEKSPKKDKNFIKKLGQLLEMIRSE